MGIQEDVSKFDLHFINKELYSKSLHEFCKAAWNIVEPGRKFYNNWHLEAICEHLEAVSRGEIRNLLINIPPRAMKSLIVSVFWPAWEWITRPNTRWLCSSYAHSLAMRDSLKCRRVVESSWYSSYFGDSFHLAPDQNEKSRFENNQTGYRIATSVGGSGTGEGADRLVCDDPHKVMEAYSKTQRDATITWWDEEMSTRGNDPATFSKVIIMQRIHDNDLSGHVLERGEYEHLCIPMEYTTRRFVFVKNDAGGSSKEEVEVSSLETSLGWKDPRKEEGELLWPDRMPLKYVTGLKKELGTRAASGQLQQDPTPDKAGLVQRDWWRFWKVLPDRFDWTVLSWDFAFKKTEDTDYVVGQLWGRVGAYYYLIDQVRDRMGFNETLQAMITMNAKWSNINGGLGGVNENLVEEKANGSAIIDTLKASISGLIAYNPEESKYARAAAASPSIESGNVFIPDPSLAPWVHNYIEEWASFPKGSNDDQVDSTSQVIKRFKNNVNNWEEYANSLNSGKQVSQVSEALVQMLWGHS